MKSSTPAIATTFLLLLPASAAFAQKGENSWLNSSGGDFDLPSNWSQNVVPGSFEAAVFDLGATLEYEVFGTEVNVGELIFGRDDVTLRLPGPGARLDAGTLTIGSRSTNTSERPGRLRIELVEDASSFLNTIEVGKNGFASRLELSPSTSVDTSYLDIRLASTLRLELDQQSGGGFDPMILSKGGSNLLGTLEIAPSDGAALPPLGTSVPLIEVLGGFGGTFSTIVTSGEPGRRIDPIFQSFSGFGSPDLLVGVVVAEDTTNVPEEIDDLGIGAATFAIEATDLNGDGFDEIVIATDAGKLSIYSPTASGGFSGPFDYVLGNSPTDIASGDYDGDGTNDLAISNFGDDDLTILLNPSADPSDLQTAANLAVDTGPSAVLTTDLGTAGSSSFLFADGDDLVVVSRSSGTATGYRAQGGGVFAKTADVQVGEDPGPSAPIDDENKKDPDAPLGVGGRSTGIQGQTSGILSIVQPNPATGGLDVTATVGLSGVPVGVAAADLDGDGAAESIVATDLGTLDIISGTTSFSRSTIPLPAPRTATAITAGRFDSEPGSEIVVGVVDSDGTDPALLVYRPRTSGGLNAIQLDLINEISLETAATALALGIGEASTTFAGLPDQPTLSVGGGAGSGETPEVTLLGLITKDVPDCNKADFNGDGEVSGADLSFILSYWGPCGTVCATDLNDDGTTNSADLGLFLGFWGPCIVP